MTLVRSGAASFFTARTAWLASATRYDTRPRACDLSLEVFKGDRPSGPMLAARALAHAHELAGLS